MGMSKLSGHCSIEKGADVNSRTDSGSSTALQLASDNGHERIVQLRLERGADVNADGRRGTALWIASTHGHERIVPLLLTNDANVNADGYVCTFN
jgi:ankyrin repeat protein